MKIGIVSDSHGDTHAIDAMLARPEVQGVECWLHAGDVAPDAEYLAMLTQRRVYKVAGNCDWPSSRVPDTEVISLAGHRILLAHGHTFGVQYDTDLFLRQAAGEECDIAVYGHTHCAEFLPGVITLINPGSIARPRDGVAFWSSHQTSRRRVKSVIWTCQNQFLCRRRMIFISEIHSINRNDNFRKYFSNPAKI